MSHVVYYALVDDCCDGPVFGDALPTETHQRSTAAEQCAEDFYVRNELDEDGQWPKKFRIWTVEGILLGDYTVGLRRTPEFIIIKVDRSTAPDAPCKCGKTTNAGCNNLPNMYCGA